MPSITDKEQIEQIESILGGAITGLPYYGGNYTRSAPLVRMNNEFYVVRVKERSFRLDTDWNIAHKVAMGLRAE